jgi:hypothetical protein
MDDRGGVWDPDAVVNIVFHVVTDAEPGTVEWLMAWEDQLADLVRRDALSIQCPKCERVSFSPSDVAEGYCGSCHAWTNGLRRGPMP